MAQSFIVKQMMMASQDLGHFNGHHLLPIRKPGKTQPNPKDRDCCLRFLRRMIGRKFGVLVAVLISAVSLLFLMNKVSYPARNPTTGDEDPKNMLLVWNNSTREDVVPAFPPPPIDLKRFLAELPLPSGHRCAGFTLPPPPTDKKRTGPRPCPVCYLPVDQAMSLMPRPEASLALSYVKDLSYVVEASEPSSTEDLAGSPFGGHPTLDDRRKSYHIQEHMNVHCGFVQGSRPGVGSGFDIDELDLIEMDKCTGVVVASAIFGNYDQLQQPKNISHASKKTVCFFMFVDEETHDYLESNQMPGGLWKIVVVRNLPYTDPRRNGKIPKLLLHRLFPNARFSLWIDGKLELIVDPYQILERFLWRNNYTFAISRHYKRFDVFVEADANKAARKYDNASIDAQVNFYRSEGLVPFDITKSLFSSDVPEGCVIIREHTPMTNLFTCLWFNEVDRFTSRDQISFAVVRDKLLEQAPFKMSMFLDCERRNFVVQGYHRDLLVQRRAAMSVPIAVHSNSVKKDPSVIATPIISTDIVVDNSRSASTLSKTQQTQLRRRKAIQSRRRTKARVSVKGS